MQSGKARPGSGRPVLRAAPTARGISMTTPTSKKTGMPTRSPAMASPKAAREGPTLWTRSLARRSAPPETSTSRPIIAPRAMIRATWPSVEPTPVSISVGRSPGRTPAVNPTPRLTTSKARNGCTFAARIRRSSKATPAAPTIRENWLWETIMLSLAGTGASQEGERPSRRPPES